jgi:hypothetical protein
MSELPRPYELLEMADGNSVEIKIKGWIKGTMRIYPADWTDKVNASQRAGSITADQAAAMLRDGKEIDTLRVIVPGERKTTGVGYWDITSLTLIAQLEPYLKIEGYQAKTFTITAQGTAPRKRFTLKVSP